MGEIIDAFMRGEREGGTVSLGRFPGFCRSSFWKE